MISPEDEGPPMEHPLNVHNETATAITGYLTNLSLPDSKCMFCARDVTIKLCCKRSDYIVWFLVAMTVTTMPAIRYATVPLRMKKRVTHVAGHFCYL